MVVRVGLGVLGWEFGTVTDGSRAGALRVQASPNYILKNRELKLVQEWVKDVSNNQCAVFFSRVKYLTDINNCRLTSGDVSILYTVK